MSYAVYVRPDEKVYIVLDDTLLVTTYTVPIGDWTHIAVTWEDTTDVVTLYADGEDVWNGTFTGSLTPNNRRLCIGARNNQDTGTLYSFDGTIDKVWVYSRALSEDEIYSLFEQGDGGDDGLGGGGGMGSSGGNSLSSQAAASDAVLAEQAVQLDATYAKAA